MSPPRAKMVTPLPPVNAVKQLHRHATANMVPFWPVPNAAIKSVLSRLAACVFAKISPANVKRGKAGKEGLTVI